MSQEDIKNYLQSHPNKWLTVKQIAEAVDGDGVERVRMGLNKLFNWDRMFPGRNLRKRKVIVNTKHICQYKWETETEKVM